MFENITIGQYYPTDSFIHRLDPRTKIVFTAAYIVMLFVINNFWGYLAAGILLVVMLVTSKIPIRYVFKGLKGILFIILLTVVLNMFMTQGDVIWSWGFLQITRQGVSTAVMMAVRLIFLVVGTSLMTLTTSPIDLTDGMEACMNVLPGIRHYAHELAMMMSIALRFIPTLLDETQKIMKAQKARGAQLDTGGLVQRAKALVPILVPLFVSAFRRADELAIAMEARCYRGGQGRTRLKQLAYERRDVITYTAMFIMIAVLWGSRYFPLDVLPSWLHA
ncbi:MAG: energy-coupling factor transporter transmembrane component T family protein [Eubacteriaceae bacterium]|jgi:energy-coupling factor transport system permease protein